MIADDPSSLRRDRLEVVSAGATRAAAGLSWLGRGVVAALATAFAEPPMPRARPLRWRKLDLVVLADVVVAFAVYGGVALTLIEQNKRVAAFSEPFLQLVAIACALPVLLRDRWPLAAWRSSLLVLAWASQPLAELFAPPRFPLPPPAVLAYLLCLYSVATRVERRVAAGAWTVSVAALWFHAVATGAGTLMRPDILAAGALLTAVPALFGHNVRVRREAQRELAGQVRRTEEERASRAVLEERARIARELHDIVAHSMSMIAIQAEAAPLVAPDAPDALKTQFAEIRTTALDALNEMRRVLGVLRNDDAPAEIAPQPGLERLDDLVAGAAAAGVTVTTVVTGVPSAVPPAVALSAYRIVQESLSNVMRHAPGSAVRVEIAYQERPPALRLQIENSRPTRAPAATSAGVPHGLIGMRERAAMLHGSLTAGPTADGGFAVTALLPLEQA